MFGFGLKNKALFFRQFATLYKSAVPLSSALDSLGKIADSRIRRIISAISPLISGGMPLSEALSRFPGDFEPFIIEMIRAGELNGSLERRLENIAAYLERIYSMRQKMAVRMIYPLILVHCGIFVPALVVLVTKGLAPYLRITLVPLGALYLAVFGFFALLKILSSTPGISRGIDSILLGFPLIGRYYRAKSAYRFLLVFADMIEAGVSIDRAVEVSAAASGNAAARARLLKITDVVRTGIPVSACLRNTGIFDEISLQLIRTGEESGTLPEMAQKASEILEKSVNDALNVVMIVAPVFLYIGIAVYIGYIIIKTVISIYQPVFNM